MDPKRYELYNQLSDDSEYGADILCGEEFQEILEQHGYPSYEENLGTAAKILHGEELFRDAYASFRKLVYEEGRDRYEAQEILFRRLLEQRTALLDQQERRALLLELIRRVSEANGSSLSAEEQLRLTWENDEKLMGLLTRESTAFTRRMLKEVVDQDALKPEDTNEVLPQGKAFSSAAWSASGLVTDPVWQKRGETLGMIGSMIDETIDQAMEETFSAPDTWQDSDAATVIGDILITASTLFLLLGAGCTLLMTAYSPVLVLLSLGDLTLKEIALEILLPMVKDYAIGAVFAIGAEAAGLLLRAGDKLKAILTRDENVNTLADDVLPAAMDIHYADVETCEETAQTEDFEEA